MARCLRKVKSKIRSFNWYWYVISGRGICHSIYGYTKANNKYMKNYDKNKESSYIGMYIIYMVGQYLSI